MKARDLPNQNGLVCVVDDELSIRESLSFLLRSAGLKVRAFASAQEFLTNQPLDSLCCLVLDVQLPEISGLDLQQELVSGSAAIPIIFITGYGDIPMSVRAMKAGAIEFLTKPFRDEDLLSAIDEAINLGCETEQLKNNPTDKIACSEHELRREIRFPEMVGKSAALRRVLQQVEIVASTDSTVLILGETGTGKELIARAVHRASARQGRTFVKLNCAALPTGLLESELFGHEKGAFTGAIAQRIGRLELADQGTIFLDEVGDMPLDLQPKLLRVLQECEFERLGSSNTRKVDVRLVAATNRNLQRMMVDHQFRSDLYYRLNVFPIHIPPLRDRREDIPLLAMFFLEKFGRKLGRPITNIAEESMRRLCAYSWPGNIRELQNVIERAVVLSKGPILTLEERALFDLLGTDSAANVAAAIPNSSSSVAMVSSSVRSLKEVERQHIVAALTQANWQIEGDRGAAKLLRLQPSTLRSRMRKLDIIRRNQF
ncbi:MAG: sigma-54 dependent transcriptional regulator [Chthoniobacterales bacterium]